MHAEMAGMESGSVDLAALATTSSVSWPRTGATTKRPRPATAFFLAIDERLSNLAGRGRELLPTRHPPGRGFVERGAGAEAVTPRLIS